MSADDRDPAVPSLEPPSLFRRKRKPKAAPPEEPVEEPVAPPVDEQPTEVIEPVEVEPEPTEVLEPVPAAEPESDPEPQTEPQAEPVRVEAAEVGADEAPPLFADEVEPEPVVPEPVAPEPTEEPAEVPREPRVPRGPLLTGLPAAIAAGLLVGVLVVLLTAGGQQGCEAVQGTSSCGRAGYLLILAILVVAVLAGGALLEWSTVPDPRSTSFLGVGLLAVIALLFLIDALDSWWMLLVIPVVSMATYAASHWVTTAVIEPARE